MNNVEKPLSPETMLLAMVASGAVELNQLAVYKPEDKEGGGCSIDPTSLIALQENCEILDDLYLTICKYRRDLKVHTFIDEERWNRQK